MLEEAREEGKGEKEIREGEGGECKGEGRATLVVERPGGPSPSQRHALSMTPRLWYLRAGQGTRLTARVC